MVLMQPPYVREELLYDVSDPLRPRLLCGIANTSTHLFTGDTFEYLKPVSATETDVMLHSLGSGNESHAGSFPFSVTSGSWLPDQSVMAYTTQVAPDNANYPSGGVEVWLYSQRQTAPLYTYRLGIGDCICRFGLPSSVLSVSPDGEYVVAGWIAGKGSEPLAVYQVSDRTRVTTLDQTVYGALWDRGGHRLFLNRFGLPSQSWTPESGVSSLAGAASFSILPGLSPDGGQVAYTAYPDSSNAVQPRVWVYDLKSATTRMLVDQSRSQAIFIKDGWVWYLDEGLCTDCPGGTTPSGKVYAMNLLTGTEQTVSFASGEHPFVQAGDGNYFVFAPGEFWPAT
jgi:Tol biopolymer transport system component